jgi:hypothetical protein
VSNYILEWSALHFPTSEANVFYSQGNQCQSFRHTGWCYIRSSLSGFPLHHLAENPSTTFSPCRDLSMIQMHGHRDHLQQPHWVGPRVSFSVSGRRRGAIYSAMCSFSSRIERCEIIKSIIDIHDCVLPFY